ncbi:MAG: hypothetical protein KGJ07_04235 [Patescibacteria group bacterium]|nr:hypothetical protein [Patescibacteria group bacterium]
MKRPIFLTVWLIILLFLSVVLTGDSLTYLRFIFLTKSYISLVGIIAGFVQIWAVIQLLRWKKIGITLFISSAIVVFLITAINEFTIVTKVSQLIVSLLMVLVVNVIMLGILYLAIKPVWKNFK